MNYLQEKEIRDLLKSGSMSGTVVIPVDYRSDFGPWHVVFIDLDDENYMCRNFRGSPRTFNTLEAVCKWLFRLGVKDFEVQPGRIDMKGAANGAIA